MDGKRDDGRWMMDRWIDGRVGEIDGMDGWKAWTDGWLNGWEEIWMNDG